METKTSHPKILDTREQRAALLGIDPKAQGLPLSVQQFLERGVVGDVDEFYRHFEEHGPHGLHGPIAKVQEAHRFIVPMIDAEDILEMTRALPPDDVWFDLSWQGPAELLLHMALTLDLKKIRTLQIRIVDGEEKPQPYIDACAHLKYTQLGIYYEASSNTPASHAKEVLELLECIGAKAHLKELTLYLREFAVLDDPKIAKAFEALLPQLSKLELRMLEPDLVHVVDLLSKGHALETLGLDLRMAPNSRFRSTPSWDSNWTSRFMALTRPMSHPMSRPMSLRQFWLARPRREPLGIDIALELLYGNTTLLDIDYCDVNPPRDAGECVLLACTRRNRAQIEKDAGLSSTAQWIARLLFGSLSLAAARQKTPGRRFSNEDIVEESSYGVELASEIGKHVASIAQQDAATRSAVGSVITPALAALLDPSKVDLRWKALVTDCHPDQVVRGTVQLALENDVGDVASQLQIGLARLRRALGDALHTAEHPKILALLTEAMRAVLQSPDPYASVAALPQLDKKTTPVAELLTQRCLRRGFPSDDADYAPARFDSGALQLFAAPHRLIEDLLSSLASHLLSLLPDEGHKTQVEQLVAGLRGELCANVLEPWLRSAYLDAMEIESLTPETAQHH